MRKTVLSYPFSDPAQFEKLKAGWFRKLVAGYESGKVLRRRALQQASVAISMAASREFRPLALEDLPMVFLCRNDRNLLPAFLQHYRALGVTRFIVVDDQSDDGSREWLESQDDVDVWISPVRYKDARRGRLWREQLFRRYGVSRWYVNVDVDEFLVYDRCETRDLRAVIDVLMSEGARKMAAPMLDLYPTGPLDKAEYSAASGSMPWSVADGFDASGYELTVNRRFMSMRGGPRRRKFAAEAELMKYPLVFWSQASSLGTSIHQPLPYGENFGAISGVLLHFKFFSDVADKVSEAVRDGQYFNGSAEYRRILAEMQRLGALDFNCDRTVRYEGSQQMVEFGFVRQLFETW